MAYFWTWAWGNAGGMAIGFAFGWLLFKRPDKLTEIIDWIKDKIKFW